MRRDEVLHVARAACAVAGVRRVLVAGSQAVLGAYDETQLPPAALASVEADVVVLDDPRGDGGTRVDAAIGFMSVLHTSNDYYADGIELHDLVLPSGWEGRRLHLETEDADGGPIDVYFVGVADPCAGKLGAAPAQDRRGEHRARRPARPLRGCVETPPTGSHTIGVPRRHTGTDHDDEAPAINWSGLVVCRGVQRTRQRRT